MTALKTFQTMHKNTRGQVGWGMHSIRVDGNDIVAVYLATQEARRLSIREGVHVRLELMTCPRSLLFARLLWRILMPAVVLGVFRMFWNCLRFNGLGRFWVLK